MTRKYIEDQDGAVFHLDRIAGIQPAPIKGDRTDQQKVTHVNTIVHTEGGAVLHTSIPFAAARKAVLEAWAPAPVQQLQQQPPADPAGGSSGDQG